MIWVNPRIWNCFIHNKIFRVVVLISLINGFSLSGAKWNGRNVFLNLIDHIVVWILQALHCEHIFSNIKLFSITVECCLLIGPTKNPHNYQTGRKVSNKYVSHSFFFFLKKKKNSTHQISIKFSVEWMVNGQSSVVEKIIK